MLTIQEGGIKTFSIQEITIPQKDTQKDSRMEKKGRITFKCM